MAIDEAILEAVQGKKAPPTLRLYAWEPACLSLGYAQPASDANLDALKKYGWGIVRRPTGGRAILHTDEITYSVIAPEDEPRVAGSILESYQRLSRALLAALDLLHAPVSAKEKKDADANGRAQNPICFEVPADWEITAAGKKLVGSAQHRRKGGVLQHGSLPLVGDIARITYVLALPDEAVRTATAERVRGRAITLEGALGEAVSWNRAADALAGGFATALNLTLVRGELTDEENERAEALVREKYGTPEWTFRL